MASVRTITAPGIELREIDRSRYNAQDNSLPNAPTILVTGFADKGENYYPQWINDKQAFISKFGAPETEEEKYFYNACVEILNRGGTCIACKLPYNNEESRGGGQFNFCEYAFASNQPIPVSSDNGNFSCISALDPTLTSYVELTDADSSGRMTMEALDSYRTGMTTMLRNKIRIVDISRSRYTPAAFPCVSCQSTAGSDFVEQTNDILGIFPVITTAANAIYFQGLLNSVEPASSLAGLSASMFSPIAALSVRNPRASAESQDYVISVDLTQLPRNQVLSCYAEGAVDFWKDDDGNVHTDAAAFDEVRMQESLSKIASSQFPLVAFKNAQSIDPTYLKQIGIVVFKAYSDPANGSAVNFQLLESFIGSLDRTAKSPVNKSSIFIDDVVNSNSQYINVFSNFSRELLESTKMLLIRQQTSIMLGFYKADCRKQIVAGEGSTNNIMSSISKVLEICKDSNTLPLDLVIDAGVSNIAQFYATMSKENVGYTGSSRQGMRNGEVWHTRYPVGIISDEDNIQRFWTISKGIEAEQTSVWRLVLKKFNDFCQYTRKDCMFIADGFRPFCLLGSMKKVRKTAIGSSVEKDITPYINHIAGINSSYAAGYCNWFSAADDYSGDYFWCPPSIKAASIYIYCDTYFHPWDAPAGMIRGIVPNVFDVAFNPNKDEAGKIYQQCWNYAISYPLEGIIMEGQKTFQQDATALDRVNVRRLLLKLEKQVKSAAKYFLYEQNTEYQRQKFVDTIRPFFEDAVVSGGLVEYAIKCDDEINTPQTIDNNELHCKIGVKPRKTIEFIVISLFATSQTASVAEEVLR